MQRMGFAFLLHVQLILGAQNCPSSCNQGFCRIHLLVLMILLNSSSINDSVAKLVKASELGHEGRWFKSRHVLDFLFKKSTKFHYLTRAIDTKTRSIQKAHIVRCNKIQSIHTTFVHGRNSEYNFNNIHNMVSSKIGD